MVPQYIGSTASVTDSMITDGCIVNGTVSGSVLYYGVTVRQITTPTTSSIREFRYPSMIEEFLNTAW